MRTSEFSLCRGKKPFDVIHIENFGPVAAGKMYTTKSTSSKEAINALKDYFGSYRFPKRITSDR